MCAGHPQTGSRVDNVRVALAANLHVLLSAARRGHGDVHKGAGKLQRRRIRAFDIDGPSSTARRSCAYDNIPSPFDHRRFRTVLAKHRQRFLEDVALGDAAEVETHVVTRQPHFAPRGVHLQHPPPDAPTRRSKLPGVRQGEGTAAPAPQVHKRADRHVERTMAPQRNLPGP